MFVRPNLDGLAWSCQEALFQADRRKWRRTYGSDVVNVGGFALFVVHWGVKIVSKLGIKCIDTG